MKKILLISDNKIFGFGGGCLEEHKYFDGLKYFANNKGYEFKVLSIDEEFEYSLSNKMKKTRMMDVFSRLCGHSSFVYFEWKRFRKNVLDFNPNIIFLGRTRFGFIAKDIKKLIPSCKVVSNFENIEYDYVDGYFSDKQDTFKSLYVLLEKWCVMHDEKKAVRYSDALNYLTTRDKKRCHSLYKPVDKYETILPICIEKEKKLSKTCSKKSIVFIGSLNYASNINALTNFITTVWLPNYNFRNDIQLIVGGSKPRKEIKELILSLNNCSLFEDFRALEDIVPKKSLVIAPIRKGAGMKVKVAETLSMGLMIAASDEALVGYEEAEREDRLGGILRVNSTEEYKKAINSYMHITDDQLTMIAKQNIELYKKYYSYNRSRNVIYKMCFEGLGGN